MSARQPTQLAQTAAKLCHSGGPNPSAAGSPTPPAGIVRRSLHRALQGGGYDDDGEAHLRTRALGAEGAPAPLRRAATLPRSPSHAPLLTWTQGPRWLALPLRRAATGRGGLPLAPLPAPHPVSLVNGGYSWPPAQWSRPLPAPTRFSPPAQMLRNAPLTLDYLRNCRRHGPRRHGPSDTPCPARASLAGPAPVARCYPARPPCRPAAHHICWCSGNKQQWQFSQQWQFCKNFNFFLTFPLFVVGIFRCGGPILSQCQPLPGDLNAISLEVGGSLLVQPCFR